MGPAYYVATTKEVMVFPEKVRSNSKLGILLDFALILPVRTRFYLELNFQCRLAGKTEIGPYEARVPSYDHWIFGVGIGFRFQLITG